MLVSLSSKCVDALSRQSCSTFTRRFQLHIQSRQSHSRASSAHSFDLRAYSTTSNLASKEAAPGKSKKPDPVKGSTNNPSKSRGSVSAVRATLRAGQHKSSANSRDAAQKKFDEDPDFAASYMASMSRNAAGVDVWSRGAPTLGGVFAVTILVC